MLSVVGVCTDVIRSYCVDTPTEASVDTVAPMSIPFLSRYLSLAHTSALPLGSTTRLHYSTPPLDTTAGFCNTSSRNIASEVGVSKSPTFLINYISASPPAMATVTLQQDRPSTETDYFSRLPDDLLKDIFDIVPKCDQLHFCLLNHRVHDLLLPKFYRKLHVVVTGGADSPDAEKILEAFKDENGIARHVRELVIAFVVKPPELAPRGRTRASPPSSKPCLWSNR